ncbi:MAG TPA: YceI family protein [Gammaproteobacteria bacterium]|jgi:polyisoprenoid-binding protein YceI
MRTRLLTFLALSAFAAMSAAVAAPATYTLDPDHTHVQFDTDHFGGLSVWRGIMVKNRGTVTLDKAAGTGSMDVYTDMSSGVIGNAKLEEELKSSQFFDATKYPESHYQGTLGGFVNGAPTTVTGNLTFHGVTKPVNLKILSFKCMMHPFYKKEVCGADATGTFNRADFGVDYGKTYGFNMDVTLRIQVEGLAADAAAKK